MAHPFPSVRLFRSAIIAAVISYCLLLSASDSVRVDAKTKELQSWNFYGADMSLKTVEIWIFVDTILILVGLVGLWFFWSPGRAILAFCIVTGAALRPFAGVWINTPHEGFVGGLYQVLSMWLVTVSYWSNIASRFSVKMKEDDQD